MLRSHEMTSPLGNVCHSSATLDTCADGQETLWHYLQALPCCRFNHPPFMNALEGGCRLLHWAQLSAIADVTPPLECNDMSCFKLFELPFRWPPAQISQTLLFKFGKSMKHHFIFYETPFRWPPAQISQPILLKVVKNKNNHDICCNNYENYIFYVLDRSATEC